MHLEVSCFDSSLDDTKELQDSISEFRTANQPVIDTTLNDMLVSLRSTLHTDILAPAQQFKSEVSEVNKRVSHIETKIVEEFASTFNNLVYVHNDIDNEIMRMKIKMVDSEDRLRRNNVKIRGIKSPDLKEYFTNIMKDTLPNATLEDLLIDCIHRLPRPKHIPSHLLRNTIVRINFYHIKDQFMSATKYCDNLPQSM